MKKILLTSMCALAALTASAADWYLCGSNITLPGGSDASNWGDAAAYKMTQSETDANVYSIQVDAISTKMKVKEAGTWETALSKNTAGGSIQQGVLYTTDKRNGDDIPISGTITNATVTANVSTGTIMIAGQATENNYNVVYVIGDFGKSWQSGMTDYALNLKSGSTNVWEGDFNITNGTSYFRLKAGSNEYGPWNDEAIVLGKETTGNLGAGKAFKITSGEYHFSFVLDKNASTGKLTVTAQNGGGGDEPVVPPTPNTDYDNWYVNIVGDFNSWNDNGIQPQNGVTVHTGLKLGTKGFKVKYWNSTDGDVYLSNGEALTPNTPYVLTGDAGDGHNMTVAGAAENEVFDVKFDCATKTITIIKEEEEPIVPPTPSVTVPEKLYLIGFVNGQGTATPNNGVEMTKEGNKFTCTTRIEPPVIPFMGTAGSFYFSEGLGNDANDWATFNTYKQYGAVANGLTISVPGSDEFKAYEPTTGNTSYGNASAWKVASDAEYTFTIDFDNNTVTVAEPVVVPPTPTYPELALVGTINGWDIANGVAMTREENVYTATLAELAADAEFKVAVPGANWTDSWGGEGVIDPELTEQKAVIALGEEMNAWMGSSVNFYNKKALTDVTVKFVYNGKDGSVASKLIVTGTEVSEPEPPTPAEQNLNVTFVFNGTDNNIASYEPAIPAVSDWAADGTTGNSKYSIGPDSETTADAASFALDNVTISNKKTDGATGSITLSCLYASSMNAEKVTFRVYKNNTTSIAAPEGYVIKSMNFNTNLASASSKTTFSAGTVAADAANNKLFTVTAPANGLESVDFTVTATMQVNSINVVLEKKGSVEEPVEPTTYPELYLMGAVNSWTASDDYKFAETDGVYVLTIPTLSGDFKIGDADWTAENTISTKNTAMEPGVVYTTENADGFGGNMAMAQAVKDVTVTYNSKENTLKVDGTVETNVVKTYWIKGAFNSWNEAEMTQDANSDTYTFTFTATSSATGACVLFEKNNDVVGSYWKQPGSNSSVLGDDTNSMVLSTDGGDIQYKVEAGHEYAFTFEPESKTLTFSVSDGVNTIDSEDADAVYYNLQGVRVANPGAGVYIRVAGNKSQKVTRK